MNDSTLPSSIDTLTHQPNWTPETKRPSRLRVAVTNGSIATQITPVTSTAVAVCRTTTNSLRITTSQRYHAEDPDNGV